MRALVVIAQPLLKEVAHRRLNPQPRAAHAAAGTPRRSENGLPRRALRYDQPSLASPVLGTANNRHRPMYTPLRRRQFAYIARNFGAEYKQKLGILSSNISKNSEFWPHFAHRRSSQPVFCLKLMAFVVLPLNTPNSPGRASLGRPVQYFPEIRHRRQKRAPLF